jgi:hypothetical protein
MSESFADAAEANGISGRRRHQSKAQTSGQDRRIWPDPILTRDWQRADRIDGRRRPASANLSRFVLSNTAIEKVWEDVGDSMHRAIEPIARAWRLDQKTLDVAGHLDAGRKPDGLAWAVRR